MNRIVTYFLLGLLFFIGFMPHTAATYLYQDNHQQIQGIDSSYQEKLSSETCGIQTSAAFSEIEFKLHQQAEHNPYMEAMCLLYIGKAKTKVDPTAALAAFEASLKIWRKLEYKLMEGIALAMIGMLNEAAGNTNQASINYQESINIVEEIIQNGIRLEKHKAILAKIQDLSYPRLINLKWQEKKYEEAFNYVERSKARAFLDQLAYGPIDFSISANAELLEKQRLLRTEINKLYAKKFELYQRAGSVDESTNRELEETEKKLNLLIKENEELRQDIQFFNPELASLQRVDVSSLEVIKKLLDEDDNTTLVEYYVTQKNTLAFIITHNSFKSISINVTQAELVHEIESLIETFRNNTNSKDSMLSTNKYLQSLHHLLIAQIKPYLTTNTIGIVPHNILHYLPFAALTDGKLYLSDEYALFTLPSASILDFIPGKRKPKMGTILALGNPLIDESTLPDLKSAEEEARAIATMYNTKALLLESATESAVKLTATNTEFLHIAAHGKYNKNNPQDSTIYLASDAQNDGRLQLHEIYSLDLRTATNLVVLSACEGQLGELGHGDEVIALNRAFLYAGTPSVVASLWQVSDEPTTQLMIFFYTRLQTGLGKAEALRQAQLELRTKYQKYQHPYYWAGFVLTGDWGK